MKAATAGMASDTQQGQTTFTLVLTLRRTDGVLVCVTEHDQDLVFTAGIRAVLNSRNFLQSIGHDVTALAYAGFSKFNINDKDNLETSNTQVNGMIDAAIFTRADIKAQRWDYADYQVAQVNWNDMTHGDIILLTGRTGTWTINEFGFSVNFYGLAKQLDDIGGEICAPTCRAQFGDSRCAPGGQLDDGTTIDSLMQTGTVTATDGNRTLVATGIADIGRPLNGGLITWASGNNSGLSIEAKLVDPATGAITLYLPTFLTIQVGDTFRLLPGCDKTMGTCAGTHHNGVNNQSEPYVPGNDWELNYPDWHAPHP